MGAEADQHEDGSGQTGREESKMQEVGVDRKGQKGVAGMLLQAFQHNFCHKASKAQKSTEVQGDDCCRWSSPAPEHSTGVDDGDRWRHVRDYALYVHVEARADPRHDRYPQYTNCGENDDGEAADKYQGPLARARMQLAVKVVGDDRRRRVVRRGEGRHERCKHRCHHQAKEAIWKQLRNGRRKGPVWLGTHVLKQHSGTHTRENHDWWYEQLSKCRQYAAAFGVDN
mmetsp:Transcript_6679/g.20240  ORF Transcript_6679/g.20240 Transcript_6679/m.20240 type:complete len:227 (-) Transcript_6679:1196-1876(-)